MECSPMDLVKLLNSLYTSMDERIGNHDVYKVETIIDSYMVASGLPNRNGDTHVLELAYLALDILHMMKNKTFPNSMTRDPIKLLIGINTGPVSAGIVGTVMLRYCLFGDTVNIASRMKTYCLPNRIHLSESTFQCLKKTKRFRMKSRGSIDVKGKGPMNTYWLQGIVSGMDHRIGDQEEMFPNDHDSSPPSSDDDGDTDVHERDD